MEAPCSQQPRPRECHPSGPRRTRVQRARPPGRSAAGRHPATADPACPQQPDLHSTKSAARRRRTGEHAALSAPEPGGGELQPSTAREAIDGSSRVVDADELALGREALRGLRSRAVKAMTTTTQAIPTPVIVIQRIFPHAYIDRRRSEHRQRHGRQQFLDDAAVRVRQTRQHGDVPSGSVSTGVSRDSQTTAAAQARLQDGRRSQRSQLGKQGTAPSPESR
jgi:hypothetical protein